MSGALRIIALVILAAAVLSCGSAKNKAVYTGPPSREVPLDSVGNAGAGPYRLGPFPEQFAVEFYVPGEKPCSVKIDFYSSAHKLIHHLADSVYAPGSHKILWDNDDGTGHRIPERITYYYKIKVCDRTYTDGFFYRREYR